MAWSLRSINLRKVLRVIVVIEMICWLIITSLTVIIYFKTKDDPSIKNELKTKNQANTEEEVEKVYQEYIYELTFTTQWMAPTGAVLFFIQLFLWFGVTKKNRCLIFSWIFFSAVLGVVRIIIIVEHGQSTFLKYAVWLWTPRVFFLYLAARFILQITNERRGEEPVEAPHFRPQTEDPRQFREGLNYPAYPRSLEFADRTAGVNKFEHASPKRWVPTYDAFDYDGRMIVVVDDPIYESL